MPSLPSVVPSNDPFCLVFLSLFSIAITACLKRCLVNPPPNNGRLDGGGVTAVAADPNPRLVALFANVPDLQVHVQHRSAPVLIKTPQTTNCFPRGAPSSTRQGVSGPPPALTWNPALGSVSNRAVPVAPRTPPWGSSLNNLPRWPPFSLPHPPLRCADPP